MASRWTNPKMVKARCFNTRLQAGLLAQDGSGRNLLPMCKRRPSHQFPDSGRQQARPLLSLTPQRRVRGGFEPPSSTSQSLRRAYKQPPTSGRNTTSQIFICNPYALSPPPPQNPKRPRLPSVPTVPGKSQSTPEPLPRDIHQLRSKNCNAPTNSQRLQYECPAR